MAHVQLRLSCEVGPVEVDGSLSESLLTHVARVLRWHLKVLRYSDLAQGDKPLKAYVESEQAHADKGLEGRPFRGVLMLLDLSLRCDAEGWDDLSQQCKELSQKEVGFILCEP